MFSKYSLRSLLCGMVLVPLTLSLAGCANPWSRGQSAAPMPPATLGPVIDTNCDGKGPVDDTCLPGAQ